METDEVVERMIHEVMLADGSWAVYQLSERREDERWDGYMVAMTKPQIRTRRESVPEAKTVKT